MTFDEWLQHGIANNFCSEQFCNTHDVPPLTDKEFKLWYSSDDVCCHMVRLGSPIDWDNNLP